jgi:histidinol dehydrogenase
MKHLSSSSAEFWSDLAGLLAWESSSEERIEQTVKQIIADIRSQGDVALVELTNRFDRRGVSHARELEIPHHRLQQAFDELPEAGQKSLATAAARIRTYHERQTQSSWHYVEADGTLLGQQVTALDSVGLYVPGGKAAYPSSVLMNAIPAKVAGVSQLIMVVPTPDEVVNEWVLAAAYLGGVDRVFTVGGAQAIAALAYGTQTIPAVDKIVGPGNIYVATAKRIVFGTVGIDMIAGPSEILVVSDGMTDPDWIAMDLFSQAEHDEDAQSILVTWDEEHALAVQASIDKLLPQQPRQEIIRTALTNRGGILLVKDEQEAAKVVNYVSPEHLELSVEDPQAWLPKIRHAGAIFMGRYTAEAIGDYCAGPNHVLPTARTARFSSPLGVYDFQKRSSLIFCSPEGASTLGEIAGTLADAEGLFAHAASARYRVTGR